MQKDAGPRRGPTKTFHPERRPHRVPFCAKRGLSSTSVISHEPDQDRERDWNRARVWGVRPRRGRGFFWGRLSPGSLAPSARRSPGAIQGMAPPGPLGVQLPLGVAWRPIVSRGGLASNYLSGPLGVQLSLGVAWRIDVGRLARHG